MCVCVYMHACVCAKIMRDDMKRAKVEFTFIT